MGTPVKQELGGVYGLLTVIEFAGQTSSGHALWRCQCACGNEKTVFGSNLRRGHTTSCGCYLLQRITKHGAARRGAHAPEYAIFQAARDRCRNPNDSGYVNYGGRGIKFLFESFEQFRSELGSRPSSVYTLDRFPNNDGNYEPGNVRWATRKEQIANQRKRIRLDQYSNAELVQECSKRGLFSGGLAQNSADQIA